MAHNDQGSSGSGTSGRPSLSTSFRFFSFRRGSPASVFRRSRSVGCDSSRSRAAPAEGPPRPPSPVQPLPLHASNVVRQIRLRQPRRINDPDQLRRWAMFDQLMTYEKNYMRTLVFLTQDCYDELVKDESVLPRETAHQIFAYLPELRVLHERFQHWLVEGAFNWHRRETAGWIFAALLEQPALLSAYSRFVANYGRAVLLAEAELRSPDSSFSRFIERRLRQIEPRLSFMDVFMRPIQRMIHLEQQIGELMHATPDTHVDLTMLRLCSQRAHHVVSQLDILEGHVRSLRTVLGPDFPGAVAAPPSGRSWRQTELLCCEDLSHTVVTRQGVRRQKIRRLFLLTDRIVCAEVRGSDGSARSRFETRLRLRWMLPLADVELQGVSPRGARRPHQAPATDAYMDMLHAMVDTTIAADIRGKVDRLRQGFGGLSQTTVDGMIAQCGVEMTRIDQEARIADECYRSCELLVSTRADASPLGRRKSHLIRFPNPAAKQRWYANARLAQRALHNDQHWWTDQRQLFVANEPVAVDKLMPGSQSPSKVRLRPKLACWCYFAPNKTAPLYTQMPLKGWLANWHTLWICTHHGTDTVVTVYTHDLLSNTLVERTNFLVKDALITCAVHVPHGAIVPGDATSIDTVWLGRQDQLLVYSAAYPLIDKQLACVPISGNPTHLLYHAHRVYVGLDSGQVLIFHSGAKTWDVGHPVVLDKFICPVAGMLALDGNVCVAAGSAVYVIDGRGDWLRRDLKEADLHPFLPPIRCMVHSVHGMWLVRYHSSLVSLHRVRPWRYVHVIDVRELVRQTAPIVSQDITDGKIYVMSIAVVDDTLWIGTSVGVTLVIALPSRRYVPPITNFLYGVKQDHVGAVNMMLPLVLRSNAAPTGNDADDGQAGYDFPDFKDSFSWPYDYDDDDDSHDSLQLSEQHSSDSSETIYDNVWSSDSDESESAAGPSTSTEGARPKPTTKPGSSGTATQQRIEPASVLVLAGGSGYLNWHNREYYSDPQGLAAPAPTLGTEHDDYSDQPHIVVWEKRLNNPLHRFT